MKKFDEQPLAIPNPDGGPETEFPKEDLQHAWLTLAVLAARSGHDESFGPTLAKKGFGDERGLLAAILSQHGFDDRSVEFLLNCIAPKKVRGRRRGSPQEFWADYLAAIKDELRAAGHAEWGIHKDAMDQLEIEAPEIHRSMLGFATAFNRDQLEDYVRRSKKSRSKKSRAK
jgi:hypothetical protein